MLRHERREAGGGIAPVSGMSSPQGRGRGDRQGFMMGEGIVPLDAWRTVSSASVALTHTHRILHQQKQL